MVVDRFHDLSLSVGKYYTYDALDLTVHGPPCANTWAILKHVRLASGWYASYWNSFLLMLCIHIHNVLLVFLPPVSLCFIEVENMFLLLTLFIHPSQKV